MNLNHITVILLTVLALLYILVMKKLHSSKPEFSKTLRDFSIMEFFSVFRGRVFKENIMEAFIALALVITVFFIGVTHFVVVLLDMLV